MKNIKILFTFGILICAVFLLSSCAKDMIQEMKSIVPIYEGASIINTSSTPEQKTAIMELEIDASKASEDDILNFYKETMTQKGWEYKLEAAYPNNGSVFKITKKDYGTLSGQTITRGIKKTGKITLNLRLELS